MKNLMAIIPGVLLLAPGLPAGAQTSAPPPDTGFTYQGRLGFNGCPATGIYDLAFIVTSDANGSNFVSRPYVTNGVPVTNGLFVVTPDFGGGIFTGGNLWLLIEVKTNAAENYIPLSPLQPFTPSPYAMFAATAGNVSGIVSGAQIAGPITDSSLPPNPNFIGTVMAAGFSGDGSGVTNVNATALGGLPAGEYWRTIGNLGTSPLYGNFLGTLDNQPLEMRVNNLRAFRLEPTTNGAPNVIGGSIVNYVTPGVYGATIAGGGVLNLGGGSYSNSIAGIFGSIGGGFQNTIQADTASATIGGGDRNMIQTNDTFSLIAGGGQNTIRALSDSATISGGLNNEIGFLSGSATIGGGQDNVITNAGATIGGGGYDGNKFAGNLAGGAASTIGGGLGNQVLAHYTTVGGGWQNIIGINAYEAVISGGAGNAIGTNNTDATIGGGTGNSIDDTSGIYVGSGSTISGGVNNEIQTDAYDSTIGGGVINLIRTDAVYATIPGGFNNQAAGAYSFAAGNSASALHQGTFVWGDSQDATFASTANDQFLIRAQGGVGINTSAPVAGGLSVNGSITSPKWKATSVINASGALTKSGSLSTSGGTLMIFVSGSGFSPTGGGMIGMDLKLDGTTIDSCTIYANPATTHLAFVAKTIVKGGVVAGSHTLSLAPRAGTSTDGSDNFCVTVQELPF